jgi:hypothetical protein
MADRYYTIALMGDDKFSDVVEGAAATGGNPFDLRITYDATNASKLRVLRMLESVTSYIVKDTWPPV